MKTSNQLLLGLVIILFAAIFGTAWILKSEFEKIDRDDPYYGYTSEPLSSFTAIRIEGKFPGLIQIQYAEKYEIKRVGPSAEEFRWDIQNDTLILTHPATKFPDRFTANNILARRSNFYVLAPNLSSVRSESAICKLNGWQLPALYLEQQGQGSGMALTESTIDTLTAIIAEGGMMLIEQSNKIARAQIEVLDSSSFTSYHQAIDSLSAKVGSVAQIQVPGYLFHQLKSNK